MPSLKPSAAIRYSNSLDPEAVTCPPYDVISEVERSKLLSRHDRNFVRLALPLETLGSYEAGGVLFRQWLEDGTLQQDPTESFYLYVTRTEGGATTALLAGALALEAFGDAVYPHEATMPGPKADRLEVMRTCRANMEPLWFFASTPLSGFREMTEVSMASEALVRLIEGDTEHSLFRVNTGDADAVSAALASTPVVIADGHHRYETALAYRDMRRELDGPGPWDLTLALIGDAEHLPPRIEAIHRIVDASLAAIRPLLLLEDFDGSGRDVAAEIAELGPGHIGVVANEGAFIVKTGAPLDTEYLVEKVIGPLEAGVKYEHDLGAALSQVSPTKTVFVMAPIPLSTVSSFALEGRRMPPKSTLFLPKPRSGLLMRHVG